MVGVLRRIHYFKEAPSCEKINSSKAKTKKRHVIVGIINNLYSNYLGHRKIEPIYSPHIF